MSGKSIAACIACGILGGAIGSAVSNKLNKKRSQNNYEELKAENEWLWKERSKAPHAAVKKEQATVVDCVKDTEPAVAVVSSDRAHVVNYSKMSEKKDDKEEEDDDDDDSITPYIPEKDSRGVLFQVTEDECDEYPSAQIIYYTYYTLDGLFTDDHDDIDETCFAVFGANLIDAIAACASDAFYIRDENDDVIYNIEIVRDVSYVNDIAVNAKINSKPLGDK